MLAAEHEVVLLGHGYPIRNQALRAALNFVPEGGGLRLRLTRGPIRAEMKRLFGLAETEPRNARFVIGVTGELEIVPSKEGKTVDGDAVRKALERDPRTRSIPVAIASRKPQFSTESAKGLGVTDLVSEFTTPYDPGAPRVQNIKRAAELLDGTIVKPGQWFSLNDSLGPRTSDAGFVMAPMIDEGKLKDAVGGGVSQVATTLFNAAFFAGLELGEHHAHEFYISRYPPGREATVSWGGPELTFRNDWRAPLVILFEAGDSQITVRMFSRKLSRRIEEGTNEPTDFTPTKTRKIKNPALKPGEEHVIQRAGSQGYTITFWRRVYRGDELVRDETFTTRYKPEDEILELGPKPVKPPTGSTSTTPGTTTSEKPPPPPPPTTTEGPPPPVTL